MKLFKSVFSKFHFLFLLFALLNIGFGLALYFSVPYFGTVIYLHLYAGILIFGVPLLFFLFYKDKKTLIAVFKGRLFINKFDRKNNKKLLIFSKTIAWVFLAGLLFSMLGGIVIKTGILTNALPDLNLLKFHIKLVYVMPFILILHVVTMKIAMSIKPVSNNSNVKKKKL